MKRLHDRVALVTGAGGAIGRAIAQRFAAEGATVLCTDYDGAKAEETAAAIVGADGNASHLRSDVSIPEDCVEQVEETVSRYGRIDIAANVAGIGLHRLALETCLEDWERVLRVNLTGSFLVAQAAARHMVDQAGGGRIIQIGSISGQRGHMAGIAYGASKAAAMHMCKVLAVELSDKGVMINAISPGPIESGISVHGPSRREAYRSRIPAGRYGKAAAVAGAALFLASDDCDWMTGHVLNVDGGYCASGLTYDESELVHN
ncbi:MAG: SDR family oxidoreductase [Pseudomonadota bacterium]